jgi:glutamate-1-semialdehyde 2,1-aminomutase
VPCAEQVRYRLDRRRGRHVRHAAGPRLYGREKILKFEGGYHGMSAEAQMSLAPTRLVNFPAGRARTAPASRKRARRHADRALQRLDFVALAHGRARHEIAGIIVEPLQRIIPPAARLPRGLRDECDRHGIVLIFDEIVTGFRFAYGGAQELLRRDARHLHARQDHRRRLSAGGHRRPGRHHGAFRQGGKVGQDGWLMQLGTLSGNPVAAAAGLKTMEDPAPPGAYDRLRATGQALMELIFGASDGGRPSPTRSSAIRRCSTCCLRKGR